MKLKEKFADILRNIADKIDVGIYAVRGHGIPKEYPKGVNLTCKHRVSMLQEARKYSIIPTDIKEVEGRIKDDLRKKIAKEIAQLLVPYIDFKERTPFNQPPDIIDMEGTLWILIKEKRE